MLKACPLQIKRRKQKKVHRRLKQSGMSQHFASHIGNRIVLNSLKEKKDKQHLNHALMDHITGGLAPKQRAQLLAFAVKQSLVEAVNWADQARYTAASMENARRADQRHSTARLKKNRQERIKILKPIEVGLF